MVTVANASARTLQQSGIDDDRAVRAALDVVVRRHLLPASLGLCLLYLVLVVGHLIVLPSAQATPMAAIAFASALVMGGLRVVLGRGGVTAQQAQPVAALVCVVVFVNSLLHILVTGDVKQTTNVAFTIIGCGGILLSRRVYWPLIGVAILCWGGVVLLLASPLDLTHYQFMLLMATVLSALIFIARLRTYRYLERLRLHEARQRVELEETLRTLRQNQALLSQARDAAEAASRAKSAFLSNMSHELRTPLSTILGYSELLIDETQADGSDRYAADLVRIRTAGRHLQALISSVLDLARIEAGRMPLSNSWFDLRELVPEVSRAVARAYGAEHEPLAPTAVTPLRVYADSGRVEQALKLLCEALLEWGACVPLQLDIESTAVGLAAEQVRIIAREVRLGFSPEQMQALLHELATDGAAPSGSHGSAEIKLVLARKLFLLMGGDVRVVTQGNEDLFIVELPKAQHDDMLAAI